MGNNADAVAGTSDETKLIEELAKLKLADPQMTNKELADKLEIPLKNCRQLIKKLRKEAEQGAVKSSDKKTANPMSSPKSGNKNELLKGTLVELKNLKSRPEVNGRTGLLMENNLGAEKNRWQVRDLGTGVDRLLKPENLSANDPFLNLLAKDVRCLNEDCCDTLTKMVRRKVRKISAPMSWGNLGDASSSFTDLVGELLMKKAAPSSTDEVSSPITTLFLDLAGFGHHLIVQIVQVKDLSGHDMSSDSDGEKNKPLTGRGAIFLGANAASFCARLFQCWVKADGAGGGYTLNHWLRGEVNLTDDLTAPKKDSNTIPIHPMKFKWLVGTEVFNFCSQIDALRDVLDDVVRSDLLFCARQFVPSGNLTETRYWASEMKVSGATEHTGLTLQPGFLAGFEEYIADMQSLGLPAHAVVFKGLLGGNPQQILDFPAWKLKKIMILGWNLFCKNVSAATFLSILEWWQQPEAWSCSLVEKM